MAPPPKSPLRELAQTRSTWPCAAAEPEPEEEAPVTERDPAPPENIEDE